MDFGEHCSYKECSRLDFLPFTCDQCHKIFCKDHNLPEEHDCTGFTTKEGSNSDENECLKAVGSVQSYLCSVEGCKKRELVAISCPHCSGIFCLQHRHQTDHSCPAIIHLISKPKFPNSTDRDGAAKVKESSLQQRSCRGQKFPLSDKAARMEAKVRLMKLKMKAEGLQSIPQAERVFYFVRLPGEASSGSQSDRPMFFSKQWSVGKVVDFIAQQHKLSNENNLPHSQKRLVLHDGSGNSLEMSRTLNSVEDSLHSGDTVVLKYVPTMNTTTTTTTSTGH